MRDLPPIAANNMQRLTERKYMKVKEHRQLLGSDWTSQSYIQSRDIESFYTHSSSHKYYRTRYKKTPLTFALFLSEQTAQNAQYKTQKARTSHSSSHVQHWLQNEYQVSRNEAFSLSFYIYKC